MKCSKSGNARRVVDKPQLELRDIIDELVEGPRAVNSNTDVDDIIREMMIVKSAAGESFEKAAKELATNIQRDLADKRRRLIMLRKLLQQTVAYYDSRDQSWIDELNDLARLEAVPYHAEVTPATFTTNEQLHQLVAVAIARETYLDQQHEMFAMQLARVQHLTRLRCSSEV